MLSGSRDLYQWLAISSASPFTMVASCLIFAISFLKFEVMTKDWSIRWALSSWRLYHRLYEKEEEDQTLFSFIHPSCPLRSDLNTVFFMKSSALSDTLQFATWLRPQEDMTLSKVLKCSFLAESSPFLSAFILSLLLLIVLTQLSNCKMEGSNGSGS